MIFGMGAEIIETESMGKMAARGMQDLERIFTAKEIRYCESKARKSEHYAARYAAKQAVLNALNPGVDRSPALTDMEVVDDERGMPELIVRGSAKELFEHHRIRRASLSLSHTRDSAIAVIILED